MWFIGFALVAATCISLGVFGWASYLERAAASAQSAHVAVPLPPPKPKRKARSSGEDNAVEVVRVPNPEKAVAKARQKHTQGRANRQGRPRETW
jgi:hypothetical protein